MPERFTDSFDSVSNRGVTLGVSVWVYCLNTMNDSESLIYSSLAICSEGLNHLLRKVDTTQYSLPVFKVGLQCVAETFRVFHKFLFLVFKRLKTNK